MNSVHEWGVRSAQCAEAGPECLRTAHCALRTTLRQPPPPRGAQMPERWFTDEELREMSRPTMDRAIEAIDRGDLDRARALCEAMKHEWRSLHDLMVEGIAGLITFVQDELGDEGVARAWRESNEKG